MQSIRDAFELHRSRVLSRSELERRLASALAAVHGDVERSALPRGQTPRQDRRSTLAARAELVKLLPQAPYSAPLLRALLTFEKRPYSEQAERYAMALADATGEVFGSGWADARRMESLAAGTYEACTDCDLVFEGIAPRLGPHNVELRWPVENQGAALHVYDAFLTANANGYENEVLRERFRAPWRLDESLIGAPRFRRSSLVRLFEDLAPHVEDVRFVWRTQTVRYEVWIVANEPYVVDHPQDIDAFPGEVLTAVLSEIPRDEALHAFVALHWRTEAARELRDLEERRSHASLEVARAAIEQCRSLGEDVTDLSARLGRVSHR